MKRRIAMMLAATMTTALIAGCGAGGSSADSASGSAAADTAATSAAQSATSDASEAVEAATSAISEAVGDSAGGDVDWSDVKVGLTMATNSFEYFVDFRQGLVDAVEARGGEVIEGVVEGQAADIQASCETFVLQGCQLIVDFNQKPEVYENGYAEQLKEKGVSVIEIDQIMEEPVYFVGGDQYEQGTVQSTYVCDWIDENWGGECDYLLLFYNQNSGEAQWNRQYATEAVAKERLGLTDDQILWLDQAASGDTVTSAAQQARDFVSSHPDSKIYIQSHSDIQATGIVSAVEQLGRTDDVVIGSHDGNKDVVEKIKEMGGKCLVVTAFCDNTTFGEKCCDVYEAIVAGNAEHINSVECVPINYENADEFLN